MSLIGDILPPEGTTDPEAWYRAYSVYQSLTKPSRNQWVKKREHIISSISYSVGLANAWRFAYVAYNAGRGALFLPFLILTFTIGIPLLILECLLGQFTSGSPITAFNFVIVSKGIGVSMVVVSWLMSLYSVMFIVYPIKYLFLSLEQDLPWTVCKKTWPFCVSLSDYSKFNKSLCANVSSDIDCPNTSSNKFWLHTVLGADKTVHFITSLGDIKWDKFIILAFSWGLIFLCTVSGLKGISRAALVSFLYSSCVLAIVLVATACQTGAVLGLEYFFVPDFTTIYNPQVWTEAGTQVMMTFGLCTGGQILLSSYNKFDCPQHWHIAIIAVACFVYAMLTAITVFSTIGHVAYVMDTPVEQILTNTDPGLILQVFMEVLGIFPGANIWCIIFLLMIFMLTLPAQMLLLNVVTSVLYEEIHYLKNHFPKVRAVICVVSFLIGICFVTEGGIYIIEYLNLFVPHISFSGIALAEVVFLSCCYGVTRFFMDIHFMLSFRVASSWAVLWILVCPTILLLLFAANIYDLFTNDSYSDTMRIVGRAISFIILVPIPCGILFAICYNAKRGMWTNSFRPHAHWGPRDAVLKLLYTNWIKTRRRVDLTIEADEDIQQIGSDRKVLDLREAILVHMRKDILLTRLGNLFHTETKNEKETTV